MAKTKVAKGRAPRVTRTSITIPANVLEEIEAYRSARAPMIRCVAIMRLVRVGLCAAKAAQTDLGVAKVLGRHFA